VLVSECWVSVCGVHPHLFGLHGPSLARLGSLGRSGIPQPGNRKVRRSRLNVQPARCKLDPATSRFFHDPSSFRIHENFFSLKKCPLDRTKARHRIFTKQTVARFVKKQDSAVSEASEDLIVNRQSPYTQHSYATV
jgi:hypothetical protein